MSYGRCDSASRRPPLMPDVGVIGLVPDTWGQVRMGRHRILAGLAEYFNVAWMEPASEWRQALGRAGAQQVRLDPSLPCWQGFHVCKPTRLAPVVYRPHIVRDMTRRLRLSQGQQLLRRAGATRFLLYIWRPTFGYALDVMPGVPSCYQLADEYSFSDIDQPVSPVESDLLRRASLVVIQSPGLMEKKGHFNRSTMFVPNGVDYRAYSNPAPEPDDLRRVPRPRAGYTGVIKHQLDFELLIALAQQHVEWSFVLIGPQAALGEKVPLVRQLESMPNVHFLGGKPADALPAYVQHFDVAMMCYALTDYTNFIYPLKLHEYLATGRPVVSAPVRSVLEFADVVTIARTASQWSEALLSSLQPASNAPHAVAARQDVARRYDWHGIVANIAGAFCALLGPEHSRRFTELQVGKLADG